MTVAVMSLSLAMPLFRLLSSLITNDFALTEPGGTVGQGNVSDFNLRF